MKTQSLFSAAIVAAGCWVAQTAHGDDLGGWNLAEDTEKIEKAYEQQKEFQDKERLRHEEIFRQGQALSAEKQKEMDRLTGAQVVMDAASLDAEDRAAKADVVQRQAQNQAEKAKSPEDKEVAQRIQKQAKKIVQDNLEQKNLFEIEGSQVSDEVIDLVLKAQGKRQPPLPPGENILLKKLIGPDVLAALKPQLDLADAILKAHQDKLKTDIESNTSPPVNPIPPELFITTLQHDTGTYRELIEHLYDGRKAATQTRIGQGSTYEKLLEQISSGSFGASSQVVDRVLADQMRRRERIEQERLTAERRRQEALRLVEQRRREEQERLAKLERQRRESERLQAEQRSRGEKKRQAELAEKNKWKNPTRNNTSNSSDGSWQYTVHEFDRGNGWWDVIVWGRNTWPIDSHETSFWLEIPDGSQASITTDQWIKSYGTISPGRYAKQQFRLYNPNNGEFKVWWNGSYWESELQQARIKYGSDWTVRGYRWLDP